MALSITSHGDLFGGPIDEVSIALCGGDLGRVFAVTQNGNHVRYHMSDMAATGFGLVIEKDAPLGGSNLAATFGAEDRVLAAFHGSGEFRFRAFDDSLNANPAIDEADLPSPSYNAVSLAGIPPADHLLSPGGGMVARKLKAKTNVKASVGPKACYAVSAAVTVDHKLQVGVWAMDWAGYIKTKLNQTKVSTNDPAIFAGVAAVSATWEDDHLKRADFVTAVQGGSPSGPLKLTRWRRDPAITKVGELLTGEQVKNVAVAPLEAGLSSGAVTAVIDANGNLKVIRWKLGIDGSITRGADATGEAVSMVRCAWVRDRDVVTAVKLSDGILKLIYWRFPATGAAIRLGEVGVHAIGNALSVAHQPGAGNNLGETIVATNLANETLKMMRFGVVQT